MELTIRSALPRDIPHLAYIWMEATGGLIEALYEGAIPGRQTNEIVEHVFSRTGTTGCYSNAIVAEEDGKVLGGLHAYPEEEEAANPPDPLIDESRLEFVMPFVELHPTGSYYIFGIALYPEARNRGIARRLLDQAESNAKSRELRRVSLHVFEQNVVALSLYRHLGYEEADRRPSVVHPCLRYDGDVLLMSKTL